MNRDQAKTSSTPVTTDLHLPGRILGVVSADDTKDRGFVFLVDEQGTEYFAHTSGWPVGLFDLCQVGDAVSFRATRTSKGLRAYEIAAATVSERVRVEEWAETRGNK